MLCARPDRPAGMRAFDDFHRSGVRADELIALQRGGRKLVGQICHFVPEELVIAAGAEPLRLDQGFAEAVDAASGRLPMDVCCAVRALAGARRAGCSPEVDLLVLPGTCDGKRKLASQLRARGEQVFSLELPPSKRGEMSAAFWHAQVRALICRLEALTGKRISRRPLRAAVELVNRRAAAARALDELRKRDPPPLSGLDALLVVQTSFVADLRWWCERCESLVEECAERTVATGPKARILLTGAPVLWPDFGLLHLLAEAGADVVADEICSGSAHLVQPVVVDEDTRAGLVQAAAERVFLPCNCPCFAESEDRLDRLLHLAEAWRVDGVVHHTLRLCAGYDMDAPALAEAFRERGIPWLSVYTEFGQHAGLRSRVEAFVEMIGSSARRSDRGQE